MGTNLSLRKIEKLRTCVYENCEPVCTKGRQKWLIVVTGPHKQVKIGILRRLRNIRLKTKQFRYRVDLLPVWNKMKCGALVSHLECRKPDCTLGPFIQIISLLSFLQYSGGMKTTYFIQGQFSNSHFEFLWVFAGSDWLSEMCLLPETSLLFRKKEETRGRLCWQQK